MSSAQLDLIEKVHRALWDELSAASPEHPSLDVPDQIRALIAIAEPLATPATIQRVTNEVAARIDGLGPLHEFGTDPLVTEIMVNADGTVWVERAGELHRTDVVLAKDAVHHLVRRLAAPAGRRIDLTSPSVDVRLVDGSRLHAIIPPLAVDGPCVTIRRFSGRRIELHEMAEGAALDILSGAVDGELTVIVAGATGTGKTTLLNALAAGIGDDVRIVTIEDAAELALPGRHVLRLETRPETEGTAAVTLRELARHALRMRPDRIICGEMRGPEALDLVQAMNTGHRGSLSTVHANTPRDALRRIETMMLLADAELPLPAIREQLASCIDLIVMMRRGAHGRRYVAEIAAVPNEAGNQWQAEQLYTAPVEVL